MKISWCTLSFILFVLVGVLFTAPLDARRGRNGWNKRKHPTLDSRRDGGLGKEIRIYQRAGLEPIKSYSDLVKMINAGELTQLAQRTSEYECVRAGNRDTRHTNRKPYCSLHPKAVPTFKKIVGFMHQVSNGRVVVTEMNRTIPYQKLVGRNRAKGLKSSHLRGITFDLSFTYKNDKGTRIRYTEEQAKKIEKMLIKLENQRIIQATKEVWASQCWHICVDVSRVKNPST